MVKDKSPAKLSEALRHVGYEVGMCAEGARGAFTLSPGLAHDMHVEVMVSHARVLYEFFAAKGMQEASDMRLQNFERVAWEPAGKPAEAIAALKSVAKAAHKHLAHLTWERTEVGPGHEWDRRILSHVLVVADSWLNAVKRDRPDLNFAEIDDYLRRARAIERGLIAPPQGVEPVISTTTTGSTSLTTSERFPWPS